MDLSADRARIAADFHDGPLQAFAVIRMRLHVLRRLIERGDPTALAEALALDALCEARLVDMRRFLDTLRGEAGESEAWAAMVERFRREAGVVIQAQIDGQAPDKLKPMVAEALHNIQKHSGASAVLVVVRRDGPAWFAIVEDNGRGIRPGTTLKSIEARAAAAGGSVTVAGSRVEIRVPE